MLREKLLKEFLKNKNNLELRNQLVILYFEDVKKISQKIKHYIINYYFFNTNFHLKIVL
ncbi:hypothetical protein [Candidatus Phytoplasma prunorum]|uniref:hypothetical protein n=1 Tax=Candidatus Phytoplasma prunorum TaxID=47565 RepID=UPI002FF21DDC